MLEVLQRCEELIEETDGVFDVWNLPSPNGTRFDPCGYVKGWSVERAVDLLRARRAGASVEARAKQQSIATNGGNTT